MAIRLVLFGTVSGVALVAVQPAYAAGGGQDISQTAPAAAPTKRAGQEAPPTSNDQATPPSTTDADATGDIVVTGIRGSLERAVEIKRNAVQVVDSIVAQDIGKFPDPTTAAALQRVPGVQVSVDRNNELSGVLIRGLPDVLVTVDGREVFTAVDRTFSLQDLPAEALARVDVLKSQTADLVEGGVAGIIDLQLNKPFSFRKPTVVVTARGNYGVVDKHANPQLGLLLADSGDTGIGRIGAVLDLTYSHTYTTRSQSILTDRQGSFGSPILGPLSPAYFLPAILQNIIPFGEYKRKQANAALQWQVSPAVQVYLNGLYTDLYNDVSTSEFNVQTYLAQTSPTKASNIVPNGNCFAVRSNAAGTNPTVTTGPNGSTLQTLVTPGAPTTLCDVDSLTFTNAVLNALSQSRIIYQTNKFVAGGMRFEQGGLKGVLDVAYQTSQTRDENVRVAVSHRISSINVVTNVDGGPEFTVPDSDLSRTSDLTLRNGLGQFFTLAKGSLFQARADGEYDVDGLLSKIQVGLRYADREANNLSVNLPPLNPFGNVGTATEAKAVTFSSVGLPSNFIALSPIAPRLNGGTAFYSVNPAYLRSQDGRDTLRKIFGLATGQPAYDPLRSFLISEKTYTAYGQLTYDIPLGGAISLDGVAGLRVSRTNRILDGFSAAGVPFHSDKSDTDYLPDFTARLKLSRNVQMRFAYSKTIRRPDFASLNPAQNLLLSINPAILSTGTQGNPDLLPQKVDALNGSLEFYAKSGSLAITVYHQNLVNRIITSPAQQTIGGNVYVISAPRNLGQAKLNGVEVSGQYFFDFLPGALAGFGAMGSFTIADSKIGGNDPLAGLPLLGVSKYNYTAGLLYEKFGISGRLVYTFRSKYAFGDLTAQTQLREYDTSRPITDAYVPALLEIVRPAGRLDFSIGYDVTDRLRFDIGGVNVLHPQTKTYRGETFFDGTVFDDETTYSAGLRYRF